MFEFIVDRMMDGIVDEYVEYMKNTEGIDIPYDVATVEMEEEWEYYCKKVRQ